MPSRQWPQSARRVRSLVPRRVRRLVPGLVPGVVLRRAAPSVASVVRRTLAGRPSPRTAALGGADAELLERVRTAVGGPVPVVPVDGMARARLAGLGPLDLLVDASGRPSPPAVAHLPRLRRGGALVLPAGASEVPGAQHSRCRDGVVVVAGGPPTLATLRHPEADAALGTDPTRGRVLATVPGVRFEARCTVTVNVPSPTRTPRRYDAPDLALREYAGVECGLKGVVVQRGLVLPDTFRHPLNRRLRHKRLREAGEGEVVPPWDGGRLPELEGAFYHLDNEHRGFFGHALTEQLARVWGWQAARERHPGLRALVSLNRGREVATWERTLLAAAGVGDEDLVVLDRPVRVPLLVSAAPMFTMPHYVHPEITRTWDAVGRALLAGADPSADRPRRVFVSRRHEKRPCRNREEVEELFSGHGFTVVLPETLPLPEQVALLHHADVVAGFAGSGLFTLALSDRAKHVMVIGSSSYTASNEHMVAAVRGHRLDLVTCPAEVAGRSRAAFRSGFTVRMDQEGAWIRRRLAELG